MKWSVFHFPKNRKKLVRDGEYGVLLPEKLALKFPVPEKPLPDVGAATLLIMRDIKVQ
jgi:hypothetical protein